MKITRSFGNVSFEFELTNSELREAFYEYQHSGDEEDVQNTLEMFDGHEKLLKPIGEIMDDEELREMFIEAYRHAMDNDPDWSEVCYCAIEDVLTRKELMKS